MLGARTILAWLIAILVIGHAEAAPKKRPLRTQQQVQNPSANPASAPASDQRGTDQIPLTVKILPSQDAKERAEEEERERAEKAGIDKKLADETQRLADETQSLRRYTGGLAIFTLFLFFAAIGQIALFWKQLRFIRDTLKAAKDAANIARDSSEAAIAFERPYVRISEIKASIRGPFVAAFPNTVILRNPSAICTIENYGKTLAFVEETQAQLRFSADDLQIILAIGKPIPVITLKTGQLDASINATLLRG